MEGTHQYVQNTLPSLDCLQITVQSLPSKNKQIIWQSLVDLNKIYDALNWLKQNNPLYKSIIINQSIDTDKINHNIDSRIHILEDDNELKLFDKDQIEFDTQLQKIDKTNTSFSHFTVHDLGKNVTRSSDIDKYSFKRINCQPLQDRQENLDHTSYPQIFPKGCGNIIYFKYEKYKSHLIHLLKSQVVCMIKGK